MQMSPGEEDGKVMMKKKIDFSVLKFAIILNATEVRIVACWKKFRMLALASFIHFDAIRLLFLLISLHPTHDK